MHVLICSVLVISSCSATVGNYRVQAYHRHSGVSFPSHLPSLHTLAAVMQTVVNRGRIASYTIANHNITGEGEALIQYTCTCMSHTCKHISCINVQCTLLLMNMNMKFFFSSMNSFYEVVCMCACVFHICSFM